MPDGLPASLTTLAPSLSLPCSFPRRSTATTVDAPAMKARIFDPGDLELFDAVEIAAIDSDGNNLGELSDDDAVVSRVAHWCVFFHRKTGGIDDVADVKTKAEALALALVLEPLVCFEPSLKLKP